MNLKGKYAVITGASSGIGKEFSHQLAKKGMNLIICARREHLLESLAQQLREQYQVQVEVLKVDLGSTNASNEILQKIKQMNIEVQFLLNNAGTGLYGPFDQYPIEKHNQVIQLNVMSVVNLTYHFTKHMKAHGKPSHIVNIASIAAYLSLPNFAIYNASKAFVKRFTQGLALELRGTNISVNCICPGVTQTEFFDAANQEMNAFGKISIMPVEKMVRISLRSVLRHKITKVVGLSNQLMITLFKLLPESLVSKAANSIFSKGVKIKNIPG